MNQKIRQRRKEKNEASNDGTTTKNPSRERASRVLPPLSWKFVVVASVHVAAVLLFASGFILRDKFHSGEECDMTYSMRHFVLLKTSQPHPVYRLYKFTDRRDPRQQHLYSTDSVPEKWCTAPTNSTTTIVLYVPGHWGSHSQARSLGAHGLQWTGQHTNPSQLQTQQQAILSGKWNGHSNDIGSFIYDVYAVDFGEQGGALHATLLYEQSDYLAHVVETLVSTCHNPSVVLVAHSIGGLVARSVAIRHPRVRPHISSIITLATPHHRLPYGFDETIHRFYQSVLQEQIAEIPLISIAGGLRDELIPPETCVVSHLSNNSLTVLATDIMLSSRGVFGMDHRAIVWCHNLLSVLRKVIYVIAVADEQDNQSQYQKKLQDLLQTTTPADDYTNAVVSQRELFRKRYGIVKSTAIEASMLYHAELLLGLYAITCGLHLVFPSILAWCVPLIVSVLGGWWSDGTDSLFVVTTLAFVANSIRWIVRSTMTRIAARSKLKPCPSTSLHLQRFGVTFLAVQLFVAFVCYIRNESLVWLPLLPSSFVTLTFLLPVASASMAVDERDASFESLFLPSLPCLVAGKLYMIAWSTLIEFGSMADVSRFLWCVALPVYLRTCLAGSMKRYATDSSWSVSQFSPCLYLLALVAHAPAMVRVGSGYVVGQFVASIALVDVFLFVVIWLLQTKADRHGALPD